MGVSVSTLREEFKKHIRPFVSDISKYGTHSMKSGAASDPACRKIAGDFLDNRDLKILWTRPRRTSTESEMFNSWN